MNIEIIGGDEAANKAVKSRLANNGFQSEIAKKAHANAAQESARQRLHGINQEAIPDLAEHFGRMVTICTHPLASKQQMRQIAQEAYHVLAMATNKAHGEEKP